MNMRGMNESLCIHPLTPFNGWIALSAAGMTTSKPTTSGEAAFGSSGILTPLAIIPFFFTALQVLHVLCLIHVASLWYLQSVYCKICYLWSLVPAIVGILWND